MSESLVRPALVLGLLSCIGPFAIDMFLPAMPSIAADLGSTAAAMQGTITGYFIAFGLAQLVYGPWADQAGRKLPLYVGITVFLIGSLLCVMAGSVGQLIAGRVVQGLGGAAVMVIPRAVIRDMYTGHAATRLMAAIMLVISVSPMLAPLAGSGLIALFDWRAIFGVLALAAGVSLLMTRFVLVETLAPAHRQPVSVAALWAGAKTLVRDPVFMGLTFVGGFGMASFFVFIAQGAFVYTQGFGLSPTGFSLAFAVNAIGFFASSQLAAGLGLRFGARRVVRVATTGFALVTLILAGIAAFGLASLWVTVAGLFLANACLGLVIPTTMVMALDDHGDNAGLASSLGGTLQMLAGGLMVGLTGPFFDGSVTPMLTAIAVCGVLSFVLAQLVLGRQAEAARG